MNILVTGGSGFVGGALVRHLCDCGPYKVRLAVRTLKPPYPVGAEAFCVASLSAETDWSAVMADVDVVVHAAAKSQHSAGDASLESLRELEVVNVDSTLHMARQAAACGVRRFIFISSVKVNGETTLPGRPYTAGDVLAPRDPYGMTKAAAERGLQQIAKETGLELVIIRPVLVYGPGAKGNFAAMARLVSRGLPLPLGAVRSNRRSMVALDNLVDLIATCLNHHAAANQTFLVSDDEDLSTAELLERVGRALGKPARLVSLPEWVLWAGATVLAKREMASRLLGSLQVDISKTREVLGWKPPVGVDEGLRRAVGQFRVDTMH